MTFPTAPTLDERIKILERVRTSDGHGGFVYSYHEQDEVEGKKIPIMADERVLSLQMTIVERARFILSDPDGNVSDEKRLECEDGLEWEIKGIQRFSDGFTRIAAWRARD